jgi:hypothetical protein
MQTTAERRRLFLILDRVLPKNKVNVVSPRSSLSPIFPVPDLPCPRSSPIFTNQAWQFGVDPASMNGTYFAAFFACFKTLSGYCRPSRCAGLGRDREHS